MTHLGSISMRHWVKLLADEFAAVERPLSATLDGYRERIVESDAEGLHWKDKAESLSAELAALRERVRAEALKALEPIALAHKNESQRRIVWQCADAIRLALNHQEVPK